MWSNSVKFLHMIFNDVYFEIASVIQLEILRRLANFTFYDNYFHLNPHLVKVIS